MEKEKNNKGVIILLTVIIVILAVLCILFSTDTISLKSNTTNNKEQASDNSNKTIKIDESKEYVYDAEYKYDNKYTEYDRANGKGEKRTIDYYGIPVEKSEKDYLKDLIVPYININSNDATKVNTELENLYLKYAKEFDSCIDEVTTTTGPGCSQILTYRTYSYNNILSVVVIDSTQATSPYIFDYHIYNFDLNTGNIISYNDMLSKLGYSKDTILDKMKDSIKNQMDITYKNNSEVDLSEACQYNKDSNGNPLYGTTNCYDITYKLLEESINNNNLLYLTDNEGNLNILPILYFAFAQNGAKNHYLVKVNK